MANDSLPRKFHCTHCRRRTDHRKEWCPVLHPELSRQRRWQLLNLALGCCVQCGRPTRNGASTCSVCSIQRREYSRSAYRIKHGIPVEAPIGKMGRKRKW